MGKSNLPLKAWYEIGVKFSSVFVCLIPFRVIDNYVSAKLREKKAKLPRSI